MSRPAGTRRAWRLKEGEPQWRCSRCRKWAPASSFYSRKGVPSGLSSQCRRCVCNGTLRSKGRKRSRRRWGAVTAWVAELRSEVGPGVCVLCEVPLRGRRRVICGHHECKRTYAQMVYHERRARRAASTPLPSRAK